MLRGINEILSFENFSDSNLNKFVVRKIRFADDRHSDSKSILL